MSTRNLRPGIDKTIIAAIIVALGAIIGAYITGRNSILAQTEPIKMIIEATATAEAVRTQAVYMAATVTAIAQQNLESYTLSIVLPGAHTPPDSQGNTRPETQSYNPKTAIRIQIPAIGIDAPIVQGDGWEELKKGVGQKLGTANPGENGFIVLSAYNDSYGELFRYLDKLETGNEIVLYTQETQYSYLVESSQIISSSNFDLTYNPNKSTVVLTSSYPYLQDDKWIVIFAYLK